MPSKGSKRRWAVATGILIVAAGAVWFRQDGSPRIRTASKAAEMPTMTKPLSPSSPTPAAPPQETEVTIPAQDLDRLHLEFGKITQGAVRADVRVPGTIQPNAYKQVHVTPLVGGVVTQVAAELGQTVKRGQALAQIFSQDLAEAQTAYISTNAELEAEHKKLLRT
jgi:multidrug efflux pump subunit AcrA (membrane-fusion protein)